MCNPTNQFAAGYCDSRPNGPKTEVRPSMVLCAKSCVTDGRTNSPELFDSEDLSSQPPNTCQVMANIDNVLEEIAGDAWSDIQVALGGAVVKTEHARPQTRSGLVSHIVKSKMRNGLPGLDVKERCRLSISPCHQSVDTSHQSVDVSCHQSMETASDMKCNSIQSRKPLFKYIPKRLISDPLDIAVVEPGKIIFHSDTVTHNDAADNILKVAVRSNTRMASKLNLHQSSVDSVGQHDQSESEKQIQAPVDDEPGHMVTRVKREPVESAVMADITVVSDGTPLKRNVRNKRRRNFGGGSRKKGRGVEFINVETEGSTRETGSHAVRCSFCHSELFSTTTDGDMQHMALPAFLSEVATDLLPSAKAVVLPATTMALQNTDVLSLQCGGAALNSHWSVKDDCCVQYLHCLACHRIGDQHQRYLVGAQVRAVTSKTNPHIKIGQMWLVQDWVQST